MVACVELEGVIDTIKLFPLLDKHPVSDVGFNKKKKKLKIPYPGYSGAIITARLGPITQGVVSSVKEKGFNNVITLNVSNSKKNVSCKLSRNSIHMTGLTSREMAVETANEIIRNINYVRDMLKYIENNMTVARRTVDWIKEITKGPEKLVINDTNYIAEPELIQTDERGQFVMNESGKKRYPVNLVNIVILPSILFYPDYVDKKIGSYLLKMTLDYARHDIYCMQLDFVLTIPKITGQVIGTCTGTGTANENESKIKDESENIKVKGVKTSMINYNYDIGFKIDRWELYSFIKTTKIHGFDVKYDNRKDNYVKLIIHNDPDAEKYRSKFQRKEGKPDHSILVYESGRITQSGPYEEMMRKVYLTFNSMMKSISKRIMIPTDVRKIKYVPYDALPYLEARAKERKRARGELVLDPLSSSSNFNIVVDNDDDNTSSDSEDEDENESDDDDPRSSPSSSTNITIKDKIKLDVVNFNSSPLSSSLTNKKPVIRPKMVM